MNRLSSRRGSFRRLALCTCLIPLVVLAASPASAQITEQRESAANPVVEVFKSTLYGGAAGLIVGLAIDVARDEDAEGTRWGFVAGTFFGLGYGIYHVSNRPEIQTSLLQAQDGELAWRVPTPSVAVRRPGPLAFSAETPQSGSAVQADLALISHRW